jgi:hypothetical protein
MKPLTKTVLTVAVLLSASLLVPMHLCATPTDTWVINDLTDGPVTVEHNGIGPVVFTGPPEAITFSLFNFGNTFTVDNPLAGLFEPTAPTQWSDAISVSGQGGSVFATISFNSDAETSLFPFPCSPCQAETGQPVTLSTITWSNGQTSAIQVESDPSELSVTPEPSSALLFSTGLLAFALALKLRRFSFVPLRPTI